MPITLGLICLVVAFICFILAAAGVAARVNLLALGLAVWVLASLLRGAP